MGQVHKQPAPEMACAPRIGNSRDQRITVGTLLSGSQGIVGHEVRSPQTRLPVAAGLMPRETPLVCREGTAICAATPHWGRGSSRLGITGDLSRARAGTQAPGGPSGHRRRIIHTQSRCRWEPHPPLCASLVFDDAGAATEPPAAASPPPAPSVQPPHDGHALSES